ncbi:MAG: dehydrogenase, partial [Nitrospirae bacterium]|nr:dehydrogenase [Fimbriimonadaceae bacterium]
TDPFSAEGIRPAIYSGIKAAEHVAEALAGAEDALARYTQVAQSEHGGNMAWAKRLAGWMYPFSKSYYPDTDDHKLSIQPADFVYSEHPYEELVMKAMSLD